MGTLDWTAAGSIATALAVLDVPLSIATAPAVEGRPRPYADEIGPDGLIRYRYRGSDAAHRDNVGLRLAMHHAAFDRHLLGIPPDLSVELRVDILREKDGPTLQHDLLGFQGKTIAMPRRPESRPNPDFLAERYELFRKAG